MKCLFFFLTVLTPLAWITGCGMDPSPTSFQEPVITHGTFELTNSGETPIQLSIAQVRCLAGNDIIPIESCFLYLLPDYDEVDPSDIAVPALTTNQYEVTFQSFSAKPYLLEDIQIEVTLEVAGDSIQVLSPYLISRRIPKRRP